jgi:hypothetical protein
MPGLSVVLRVIHQSEFAVSCASKTISTEKRRLAEVWRPLANCCNGWQLVKFTTL